MGKGTVKSGIVHYLCDHIRAGKWQIGDRLPSENQLCQDLGVSRVSLRNALQQFIALGVIESIHGKGTFLISNDLSAFETAEDGAHTQESVQDLVNLLELRSVIEPYICQQVAKNASTELIASLEKQLETMRTSVGKGQKFVDADIQFHMEICRACENPVIVNTMSNLFHQKAEEQYLLNEAIGYYGGLYYHSLLLEAFKHRDGKRARSIMAEHLCRGIDDLHMENPISAIQDD